MGDWTSLEAPSPKFQAQEEMVPVEASVNVTVEPTQVEVGVAEKAATGGAPTVM